MAGAEVSLAELGMAGAAFASSTAADVPLAERGMAVVDFASTTWHGGCRLRVHDRSGGISGGTYHGGRRSRLRLALGLLEQGRNLFQPGLFLCGQHTAAANHLHDHSRHLADLIRRYVVQQFGDGGHRGVLVEPHEQSLTTHEVAKGPSASPRAASTKNSARMTASASPPL